MNYTIKHDRLMNLMDSFLNKMIPDLNLPFYEQKQKGWVNGKYYDIFIYWQQDDTIYEPIFERNNIGHPYEKESWLVNRTLKPLEDFFGEVNFVDFVEWKFGFKIRGSYRFK